MTQIHHSTISGIPQHILRRNEYFIKYIENHKKSKPKILDVGCGWGILEYNYPELYIVSLDLQPPIRKIKRYVQANIENALEFKNETFDMIFAVEVIEHIHNQAQFIKECARVLKPGGVLILSTPDIGVLKSRLVYLFTGKFIYFLTKADFKDHVQPLFKWQLENFIRDGTLKLTHTQKIIGNRRVFILRKCQKPPVKDRWHKLPG